MVPAGTDAGLRGLSVVSDKVVWTSGTGGTVLRTVDAGKHWSRLPVTNADELDFRDVEAFDSDNAVVLSSGIGELSAVFVTSDGGAHWQKTLQNPDATGFFDAIAFTHRNRGYLVGDPVDGRFVLFESEDGGLSWKRAPGPEALPREGLFAASGTCLAASRDGQHLWFATGGGSVARVFHSTDGAKTWRATQVPIEAAAKTAGIFSLYAGPARSLLAVGGDYAQPGSGSGAAALSEDLGQSWRPLATLSGYHSGAIVVGRRPNPIYAVGAKGSDVSFDLGGSWTHFSPLSLNVVGVSAKGSVWAAGPRGLVVRLRRR